MNDDHSGGYRLADVVRKIGLHEHLCLIYETQDEQLAAAIPFITMGLERGEKCVYIADSNTIAAIVNAMQAQGIDVDAAVRQGRLMVAKKEICPHQGGFEPDRMIEFLKDAVRDAKSAGFSAVRLADEMTWVTGIDPRPERLIEYEAKVNDFARDHDALGICQYDRRLFQPEIILNILRTHPTVVYGGFVCENPYYVPPDEFLHPQHREHEVQRMLARIQEDAANREKIRQSEERIRLASEQHEKETRALIDTIPQQIWSGPPDGKLDFCNERWRSYMGLSLEELQGDGWQKMLHPDDRDRVLKAWGESVENGTPYEQEERHRGADGKYRWFLARAVPMRDAQGCIVRWYGTNTDIEDRKRAEEELRELWGGLLQLLNTIPTMAWSVQPDGALDFVNERWLDYTGLTLQEEIEEPTRVIHPEDLPRVMEKWRVDMAAGEPSEDEMRLQRADGEHRWFLVRTAPLRDERGNIVKWYGVATDIEERKRAEEAVRRSEAYLAAAQRLTHIGNWSLDLSTGELHWSAETFRIFDFEPAASADLRNMFLSRIHTEDRPMIEQGLKNALTTTEPYEIEYRIVLPDGSVKAIRESVFPRLGKSGEVIERYGVVADITERKQAEEALRRLSGRLLQLQDEERRRIARDLHDSTGQDLVALATMLGQLRKSLRTSERKSRKLLSECKALAERCIREVRTLSYVLHPPALDQAGLAGAIRDYVRGFTERSRIHVELDLSPEAGRMPRDVELTLFRVVQESLANIQRHSGSRQAKIRMDRPSDLVLEISDSGRGTPGSLLRHASRSPFQFGVGIQSMQERVNLIGGRLEIEPTTRGTTVRVTVPLGGGREKASHSASR